jgi:hypothetical protein
VQPKAGEVEALRAALDDTHLCFRKAVEAMSAAAAALADLTVACFRKAVEAMSAAAAALADLTVALAPLELAARRSAVDDDGST